jgi:hypothetical protein
MRVVVRGEQIGRTRVLHPRPKRRVREANGRVREANREANDQVSEANEGHPVKLVGHAQWWGEHQVKCVEEVDEGEAEHLVKTVGYARQGERPMMMVGRA